MRTVRVRIEGRVQGVWFRAWTEQTAKELGLNGWVRNRLDGTVEAVFCGQGDVVDRMIELCHRGPDQARVTHVETKSEPDYPGTEFEVRPTI